MASLSELEAKRGQLIEDISTRQALVTNNQRSIQRMEAELAYPSLPDVRKTQLLGAITVLKENNLEYARQIASLNAQLAEVNAQIAALQNIPTPSNSAGDITKQASAANDDSANVVKPNQPSLEVGPDGRIQRQPTTTVGTNATATTPQETTGTNGPTRPLSSTQSVPSPNLNTGPVASNTAGVGAPNDDYNNQSADVKTLINDVFGTGSNIRIIPQSNILDKYASYTYSISLYIMSKNDFSTMLKNKRKYIPGYQLLMQSGGAGPAGSVVPGAQLDPNIEDPQLAGRASLSNLGRNQFFPLDYYIDDVHLKSVIATKGTNMSNNVFELHFKIIEPNGISLLDNLYAATQQYMSLQPGVSSGYKQNYAAQNYLMVIRFYGYDANGNLVLAQNGQGAQGTSDSNAIVEKWIPFQFTNIRFRVANKLTEYDCHGVVVNNAIASAQGRGTIPYNIELTSTTLKNLLTGKIGFNQTTASATGTATGVRTFGQTTTDATNAPTVPNAFNTAVNTALSTGPTGGNSPSKANASPQKTIVSGLADALNQFAQEQCQGPDAKFTVPDVYEIEIVEKAIQEASVVPPGDIQKKNLPMVPSGNPSQQLLGTKQSTQNDAKTNTAFAGMSIIQFIDQVVRNSTYITEQQTSIIGTDSSGKQILIPQGNPAKTFAWFRIGMEAEPLQYDYKRNDYAYKIKYQINSYAVTDVKSDFFPRSQYRGTHKQYNYWFTGENTQILDLTQDFNYLYYIVQSGKQPPALAGIADHRELEKRAFQPNSNESNQGAANNVFEPAANAADYLYSPADQSRIRLVIVGDPAWIQQGEIWQGTSGVKFNYGPYNTDGSINFESQDILFEVLFNKPVDYDLQTGLMDPGQKNYNANRESGEAGSARQSYVYKAITVESILNRGKFTQELNGVLQTYQLPKTQAATETKREAPKKSANAAVNPTPVRESTTYRDPYGTSDGAAIMAVAGTGAKFTPGNGPAEIVYDQTGAVVSGGAEGAPLPAPAAAPPTSNGQVVGPASSAAATRDLGGANGTNVGQPVAVGVITNSGVVQATSYEQIQQLQNSGQIDAFAANSARQRLSIQQRAANNPTTSKSPQTLVR